MSSNLHVHPQRLETGELTSSDCSCPDLLIPSVLVQTNLQRKANKSSVRSGFVDKLCLGSLVGRGSQTEPVRGRAGVHVGAKFSWFNILF